MKFHCKNCRFEFRAESAGVCPRCYSKDVFSEAEETKPKAHSGPRPAVPHEQRRIVLGDTKGAWQSFHGNETKICPQCGSVSFEFDWKHKEKTCKKCGSIFPLARRSA